MSDSPNPYQSPEPLEPFVPWWKKLAGLFQSESRVGARAFLQGEIDVIEGIAFFIDPNNKRTIYAASPSECNSDKRLKLVVAEVSRVLPVFIKKYSSLRLHLQDRELSIRLIRDYAEVQSTVLNEQIISWDRWSGMDGISDETVSPDRC